MNTQSQMRKSLKDDKLRIVCRKNSVRIILEGTKSGEICMMNWLAIISNYIKSYVCL